MATSQTDGAVIHVRIADLTIPSLCAFDDAFGQRGSAFEGKKTRLAM